MLFTFPSRYWFTIGLIRVFSLAGWSRRIRAEFLVLRVTQDTAMPASASCKGLSPAMATLSSVFHSPKLCNVAVLQPRRRVATPPVWALPRSLFLRVLRCFSSPRWLPRLAWMTVLQTAGLSHSEISGSKVICTCPELFAAYHVLHSLDEPRHPPCALSYFFRCPCLFEET